MKTFQVFFTIDGYEQECLVVDESEEKAEDYVKMNYLGIEKIVVLPMESRMIVEMGNMF